jgi:choline dehydrogenase-like flavoprotein
MSLRCAAVIVERGVVPQRFFVRNLDTMHQYDVLVVGSGMGGGLLASRLADSGADVLLVEAGPYLFPTHVGNLPRRLKPGRFDKHIWSLWPDFRVQNYTPGSAFRGGQGFNLGGRSLFWGGLIPRQTPWELAAWPEAVRTYLLNGGFTAAEAAVNRVAPAPSDYQTASRTALQDILAGYSAEDAAMAVQYRGFTNWSLPTGLFSTADLLMEDRLADDPSTPKPTVNLDIAVWRVDFDPADPSKATGITGWDLIAQKQRSFSARTIVLSAGTIETAKIRPAKPTSGPQRQNRARHHRPHHPLPALHPATPLPPRQHHRLSQSESPWKSWRLLTLETRMQVCRKNSRQGSRRHVGTARRRRPPRCGWCGRCAPNWVPGREPCNG